jgi:integrase
VLEGFVADCSLPTAKQPLGLKHTTVKAYLAAIRSWHIKSGLPSPTVGLPRVELMIRALRKRQGDAKRERLPITVDLLDQLGRFLDPKNHDDSVLWAMLCTGVHGILRCGEVLDIETQHLEEKREHTILTIPKSKTDVFREGAEVPLFVTGASTDPVAALARLARVRKDHKIARHKDGYLFYLADGKRASREWFVKLLKILLATAEAKLNLGLNPASYSGHSMRRGGATSLAQRGVPDHLIKVLGRWKSWCFSLYIDTSWAEKRKAAALMAKRSAIPISMQCTSAWA